MEDKIRIFASLHEPFMDMLLDDTWLTEEPISLEETKACWMWAVAIGEEVVSVEYLITWDDSSVGRALD